MGGNCCCKCKQDPSKDKTKKTGDQENKKTSISNNEKRLAMKIMDGLVSHRTNFLKKSDCDNSFLDYMKQFEVITDSKHAELKDVPQRNRMRELIDYLSKRPEESQLLFALALIETGQQHVLEEELQLTKAEVTFIKSRKQTTSHSQSLQATSSEYPPSECAGVEAMSHAAKQNSMAAKRGKQPSPKLQFPAEPSTSSAAGPPLVHPRGEPENFPAANQNQRKQTTSHSQSLQATSSEYPPSECVVETAKENDIAAKRGNRPNTDSPLPPEEPATSSAAGPTQVHQRGAPENLPAVNQNQRNMAKAIGIDLGTSVSRVAIVSDGQLRVLSTTPSYVAFNDGEVLVGKSAEEQREFNLENTVYDMKRMLGKRFDDETIIQGKNQWPFQVVDQARKLGIKVQHKGASRTYSAEELCSKILLKMKEVAQDYVGVDIKDAVISVPSYFYGAQRQALLEAGKLAGLNILRLINEPTAAVLAYGLDKDGREKNVLVYNLGGGTFDVCVFKVKGHEYQVLGTAGNPDFGGKDLDDCLVKHCMEEFNERWMVDISHDKWAMMTLRNECKKAKHELSSSSEACIEIQSLYAGVDLDQSISKKTFERILDNHFSYTLKFVDAALKDAKIAKAKIDDVILVGGSTLIPKLQKMIIEYFEDVQVKCSISGDEIIVQGAALEAAILNGGASGALKRIEYFEKVTLSKGTKVTGGKMHTIIKRGEYIPCEASSGFTTFYDDRTSVPFNLYEGERPLVKDNHFLETLTLEGITPARRGQVEIQGIFKIDENGILNCTAKEKKTGKRVSIKIETNAMLPPSSAKDVVKEADKHSETDKAELERVQARVNLEDCALDMLSKIRYDNPTLGNIDDIKAKCNDMKTWLRNNQNETKATYEKKREELRAVWS